MPELNLRFATVVVATTVVSAIALPHVVRAYDAADTGRIIVAQKEDPRKKKGPPQKASPPKAGPAQKAPPAQRPAQPPRVQQQPKMRPQPKVQQTQPKAPPQPRAQQQTQPKEAPQPKVRQTQPKPAPTPERKVQQGQPKTLPSREPKTVQPQQKIAPKQFEKKDIGQPKVGPRGPKTVEPQPKLAPKQDPKTVTPQQKTGPVQPGQPGQAVRPGQRGQPGQAVRPGKPDQPGQPGQAVRPGQPGQPGQAVRPGQTPRRAAQPQPKLPPQTFGKPKERPAAARIGSVNELKGKRKEERRGNTVIIREPGNRTIIRENNRIIVRHDESERMRRWGNARSETRGQERHTIVRRGGYDVVTITDPRGHMLRRYRRFPDGREYVLIDNRRRHGPGIGAAVAGVVMLGLAAPVISMPRERYVVDMGSAPPSYIYEALDAPPVMAMERPYTLDEIRDNVELRDRVRSVDINTINFSSGSWELSPDQVPQLQALADAMQKVIGENPSTVFMLEGHTDAVGSPEDNASLSDRRAEAVAEVLTSNFNIPPENLVTQGYGEQYPRVQTSGPSRENRRVQVRNITGLMAAQGEAAGEPAGGEGEPPPGPPPG